MELFDHSKKKPSELITQERYTPEELATLLDVNVNLIRNACYEGKLKCKIIGHDIVSIERTDAIAWSENI